MLGLEEKIDQARSNGLYVHSDVVSGHCMYSDDNVALYFMEGISHSVHLFSDVSHHNPYYFAQLPWHHDFESFDKCARFFEDVTGLDRRRVVVLANSQDEMDAARKAGMIHSELINHNAWIDYNVFQPDFNADKKYDLVINCRPENWKRPFLAAEVNSLAVIKGANHRPHDFFDLNTLDPAFINNEFISATEVAKILSESFCGGIFSAVEGACYSSSEYLLMGLPVVSTHSLGGRDVWYNENNSILVDADAKSVLVAVDQVKENLKSGKFYPPEIRAMHIAESEGYRKKLINLMQSFLDSRSRKACEIFKDNYKNKMVRYSKVPS